MLNLRVLLLDNNHLKLPGQADPNDNVFGGLHNLNKLDLSVNEISQIVSDILSDVRDLKVLNLSFNPIICNKCASEDRDVRNWCSTLNVHCGLTCYSVAGSSTNCITTASDSERTPQSTQRTPHSIQTTPQSIQTETYRNVHSPFSGTSNAVLKDSAVTATEEGVSLEVLLWGGFGVVFVVLITAVAVVTIIIYITRRRPPVTSV